MAFNSGTGYTLPECYIYLYHTDEYFILPQYPDSIADSMNSTFTSQNALSRTAPVFSYKDSGPRTIQVSFKLHRDAMQIMNIQGAKIRVNDGNGDIITAVDDDYVDLLTKKLQSITLPRYQAANKMVTPPMVALRFGNEIFIKGVISGGLTVTYELPRLRNGKYAVVNFGFTVSEVTPYDADSAGNLGSFRGLTSGLRQKMEGD